MRLLPILALLLLPAATAAAAETCAAARDTTEERAEIYRDLRLARTAGQAGALVERLWRIWTEAPDAAAQDMLDAGMALREGARFTAAREVLGDLIAYCPDYPEGWNQRAFAAFLSADFEAALADLDVALELDPRHLGALSGRALTLIHLGREDEAQIALRDTVRLNPWASERSLLRLPPETEL